MNSVVQRIILSDLETFGELRGKLSDAQQKRIYDRAYKRLYDRKLTKEQIQSGLPEEIRAQLFKLLPKHEGEIVTDAEKEEREIFEKKTKDYPFRMRGFDIWGDTEQKKVDALAELESGYNDTVKRGFSEAFCPRCKSNPCVCREID